MQFSWRRLAVVGGMTIIGGLGFWNIGWAEAQATSVTDYALASQNLEILTQPATTIPVVVAVRNLSGQAWPADQLRLGTIFSSGDTDRPSVWRSDDWLSDTRIGLSNQSQPIYPSQVAVFSFTIKSPVYRGLYREYFRPLLEGSKWLTGDPVVLDIQVGNDVEIQEATPVKEIQVYRSTQQMNMLENGYVVATLSVSSGKAGYTTPAGQYKIMNHIANAYSSEYELWMPNWMAITSDKYGFKGYGLHSLPYWTVNPARYTEGEIYPGGRLYTQGRLYEGFSHLGTAVSHGCVRTGIRESEILYNWAPDGTPVLIV